MHSPNNADAPDEALAIDALTFLAQDQERFERFLQISGLELANLRPASAANGFLAGILNYLIADEPLLLSFAAQAQILPARIVASAHRLDPPVTE